MRHAIIRAVLPFLATDDVLGASTAHLGQNTLPDAPAVSPVPPTTSNASAGGTVKPKRAKPVSKPAPKRTLHNSAKAKAAKQAAKRTAKPANATPADASKPNLSGERAVAHAAAAAAVAVFYNGLSLPFKAAGDTFKPLNFDNAKSPTPRQSALLLAMLTYGAANIKADGTFTRGGFLVPAKLLGLSASDCRARGIEPDSMLHAQPESGCLGNMLNRAVAYVSGPKAGAAQRDTVLRLRPATVRAEIAAVFGDKHAKLCDSIFGAKRT